MRLFLLTALTITAFAANSVLNRMALVGGSVDALVFAAIRLGAGAIMLGALCLASGRRTALWGRARGLSVAALLAYMIGFSLAYRGIDAGTGFEPHAMVRGREMAAQRTVDRQIFLGAHRAGDHQGGAEDGRTDVGGRRHGQAGHRSS